MKAPIFIPSHPPCGAYLRGDYNGICSACGHAKAKHQKETTQ